MYGALGKDLPSLAMASGAAAYAPRSSEVEGLLKTCIDVAAGKMVFPFLDIRNLQKDPMHHLSKKEKKILETLAKGLTNRELSTHLGISINTVKFHLSNLFEKLNVKNQVF